MTKISKNRFNLDPEKLATTDDQGNRVLLFPEDVKGPWKNRRHIVYWCLITLYLTLPWIYIKDKPALMINLIKREFTFMGSTFYGVDPVLFFLIVISGIFLIAFLTSLLGRVWCGWACPQTVFIQTIFQKVEQLIEGTARQRRALSEAPMSFNKFYKYTLKWIIFILISLHIAHTFIGYIVGPRELVAMTMGAPMDNLIIFIPTMILAFIIAFDFGWFKEQFCIIACPYGRIQSVIMDDNSLVVSYDTKRGEPRRGSEGENPSGDCINCYHCVKVCPTGIDIRQGNQLECIACTNCIDACDDIMTKINKPKGLIKYSTENEIQGKPRKKVTLRSLVYIGISVIFLTCFGLFINQSTEIKMMFLRNHEPFTLKAETVTNRFVLKLNHQSTKALDLNLELDNKDIEIILPGNIIHLDKHEIKKIIFFRFNKSLLQNGSLKVNASLLDAHTKKVIATKEVSLVGPN